MENIRKLMTFLFVNLALITLHAASFHLDVEIKGKGEDKLTAGFCLSDDPLIGCDLPEQIDGLNLPPRTIPTDGETGRLIFMSGFDSEGSFAQFTPNPGWNGVPGSLEPGEELQYEALESLRFWDPQTKTWGRPAAGADIELSGGIAVEQDTSCGLLICPPKFLRDQKTIFHADGLSAKTSLYIDVADRNGIVHRHLSWHIRQDESFQKSPPHGVYLVALRMLSNLRNPSDPFFIAFNFGVSNEEYVESLLQLMETSSEAPSLSAIRAEPNTVGTAGGAFVSIVGTGFIDTPSVLIDGSPVTSVNYRTPTLIEIVTPPLTTGAKTITITNPDSQQVISTDLLSVVDGSQEWVDVGPDTGGEANNQFPQGEVTLNVASNSFQTRGRLSLTGSPSSISPIDGRSNIGPLRPTGFLFDVDAPNSIQPINNLTFTIRLSEDFLAHWDETQLRLARLDPLQNQWQVLPSQVDSLTNTMTATTDHLSTFQIMSMLSLPSGGDAIAFPSPYKPGTGNSLTVATLPVGSKVQITNAWGASIKEIFVDSDGGARWNGTNDDGEIVPSGVYLLETDSTDDRIKIVVQR